MNDANTRVLVVDDTVTYRLLVKELLTGVPNVEVVGTAPNGKIALSKIEQLRPDLLTLDLEMPVMDGLELLRHLKESNNEVGAIVLSGTSKHGANATMTALELGAFDFVAKPAGSNSAESSKMLKQQIGPKIEAFARAKKHRTITHRRHASAPSTATSPRQSVESERAGQTLQSVSSHSGQVDVIAVGISTGGPQALNQMLPQLPADLPVPVLLVQHMPPVFTKSLADDLNKRCAITVVEGTDGQEAVPGHVFIAPGGKQMKVVRESTRLKIRITDDPPENNCLPSVDYLFRSVTRVFGPNAVAVIMTGMGTDGAQGCRQMKQRGAKIIAQDEASCVVFGMPRGPVEEGIADLVLPLNDIAAQIVRLARRGAVACT